MSLSQEQIQRYSRHLTLPQVGLAGQQRLAQASVLLVGVGGLGSPAAIYLAAAGVGRLGLVDHDRIDLSNLQRQILYDTADVGRPKVALATQRIRALNPHVRVDAYEERLEVHNALRLIEDYDLVLDGTDNFETRYLINDACVLAGRRNVYGSIFRFEGQVSVFASDDGPCYRCLYPQPPDAGSVPSCAEGGVLGVLPGIIGTLQATEALKLLLGQGEPLIGRLLLFDALEMRFRELRVRRDPDCPVCGETPQITELRTDAVSCELNSPLVASITPQELEPLLGTGSIQLLDVRSHEELAIVQLPGARHIPLGELGTRLGELDRERPLVVYCKIGERSARAVRMLRARGFGEATSLEGGIDRYTLEIDSTLPRY